MSKEYELAFCGCEEDCKVLRADGTCESCSLMIKRMSEEIKPTSITLEEVLTQIDGCFANYWGGYHDEREYGIFKHGMQTVRNSFEARLKQALKPKRVFEEGAFYPVVTGSGDRDIVPFNEGHFFMGGMYGSLSADQLSWIGEKLTIDWPEEEE